MASSTADVASAVNDLLHLDEADQASLLDVIQTISLVLQATVLSTLTVRATVTMKLIVLQVW